MRDLSPTPPIESKAKEKESNTTRLDAARARARDPRAALTNPEARLLRQSFHASDRQLLMEYIQSEPTLERACAHLAVRGKSNDRLVREWYDSMNDSLWLDRQGNPIRNWCALLDRWLVFAPLYAAIKDPGRLPDARKRGTELVNKLEADIGLAEDFCNGIQ